MTTEAITPLRQRMIEDMTSRNHARPEKAPEKGKETSSTEPAAGVIARSHVPS